MIWATYHASVKSKSFYSKNPLRIQGILARGSIHIIAIWLVTEAFAYAADANVNQGIIAGVLSSNIIFTSIIFNLVYGEKITCVNKICMLIIISGVVCVSIKQEKSFE